MWREVEWPRDRAREVGAGRTATAEPGLRSSGDVPAQPVGYG